jgi:hypothetical protein
VAPEDFTIGYNSGGYPFIPAFIAVAMLSSGSEVYGEYDFGDGVEIAVAPEPATMGLLALGGLMLRRRKRA